MTYKHLSQIQTDEHATIAGVDGKKVFVIDNAGNQITSFGGLATVNINGGVSFGGNVTVNPSPNFIGLVSTASVQGKMELVAGSSYIGLVSAASIQGKVQLVAGTNAVGLIGHDITGIADGRTVVTTAGTRVVLAASTACKKVDITAETDNTGIIVVGSTTVVASLATRRGIPLNAGDTYSLEIDNLNDINLDSTVSGDGVTYTYFT